VTLSQRCFSAYRGEKFRHVFDHDALRPGEHVPYAPLYTLPQTSQRADPEFVLPSEVVRDIAVPPPPEVRIWRRLLSWFSSLHCVRTLDNCIFSLLDSHGGDTVRIMPDRPTQVSLDGGD
jgi:hypothetical protein